MVSGWLKSVISLDLEKEVVAKWIGRRVFAVKCGTRYAGKKTYPQHDSITESHVQPNPKDILTTEE